MDARLEFDSIRCFSSRQEAVLRPITLLVGENSSGKSAFLAICRIASSLVTGSFHESLFDEPPFRMGAYEQIASYRGGRAGRAKSFSVGVKVGGHSVSATYVPRNGQPYLREWRLSAGKLSMGISRGEGTDSAKVQCVGSRGNGEMLLSQLGLTPSIFVYHLPESLEDFGELRQCFSDSDLTDLERAVEATRSVFGPKPYAFAPMRTSPQRTYDPVAEERKPEGSHVPMLLSRLSHSPEQGQWGELQQGLREFGAGSGLFDEVTVIRKGKKESDPFQIGVASGGPSFNLVDVGYGVSQVLPILVDTVLSANRQSTFLLQQPEVHLHPRAQAELASFFAQRAGASQRFVIETHSDYLVDRIRMEVRPGGKLRPQDVSLLYFERGKQGVRIYNLELDANGGITNAPPGYRQFFLREEDRLLGI